MMDVEIFGMQGSEWTVGAWLGEVVYWQKKL